MNLFRRVKAFIIRDFQLAISYRFEFLLKMLWILGMSTTFFFIAKLADGGFLAFKYPNWKELLPAWLTGMAMLNYFLVGFSALANVIRQEQMQGTLESVLLTPINIPTVIISSSAWAYVEATFYSFLYLFFGWAFFGVEYKGNYLLALVFLILTTMSLASIGILSASFAMVFKRGDPFAVLLGAGTALFSGVFFPKEMLVEELGRVGNVVSSINPSTHGLEGIREILIQGKTFAEVQPVFLTLVGFLGVLLPFSLWMFTLAVRKAKRDGSLIKY
ncbi:MAG: ABC transporter permease [Pyrinomonadaceae bacterium]